MKQYEIFYSLENGNYCRETVYGKRLMKLMVKRLRESGRTVRVYTEHGFKMWWI